MPYKNIILRKFNNQLLAFNDTTNIMKLYHRINFLLLLLIEG
nr:MAG TPA: hypothetical protein [Caudoviricetes sp.]